jgi:toxin YoeB
VKTSWWREAWHEYTDWNDRTTIRRVNALIMDIERNGHDGIGKPEALPGDLAGFWSRRIDQKHRLVYRLVDGGDAVETLSCRSHYRDH